MARLPSAHEVAAVGALCRGLGFGKVAPVLLRAGHHRSYLLAGQGLVARVQSAEPPDEAFATAAKELAVARHLARHGAPTLAPGASAGPHRLGPAIVTLWPAIDGARPAKEADQAPAAASLHAVHEALRDYPGDLPPHDLALDRCRALLGGDAPLALAPDDRHLLRSALGRLRAAVAERGGAPTPIHGDAHLGNLLIGPHGPVWLDFEEACLGVREADIAALPAAAWPLFPDADRSLVADHARLKSVCVAAWCAADATGGAAVAEAAAHHLAAVRAFAA